MASLTRQMSTYPVEGYKPLQDPPAADLMKANRLLGYMKTVLSTTIDTQVLHTFYGHDGIATFMA